MAKKENIFVMQKNIRLWEVLTAFVALCTGFGIIIWNVYTMVIEGKKDTNFNTIKIEKLEERQNTLENKWDNRFKSMEDNIQTIRIIIENKQDRK